MSSKAATLSPKSAGVFTHAARSLGAALLLFTCPVAAQDDQSVTQAGQSGAGDASDAHSATANDQAEPAPAPRPRERINLAITVPRNDSDELLEQDCEDEADAAKIAGEIIVCRQLGEATDGSWDREEWQRRYAERTQGEQPVDVAGEGIFRGPATVGGLCLIPPCPPEAAIMIDVEALPEAPAGTDADRIARGLPPLGRDEELTPEQIRERRRALGLDAPPLPTEE